MGDRKYEYHTVNLPKHLAAKIQEAIDSGEHGFTAIPEFVRAAVRDKLRELGYII